jgi:hypothetical protein
MTLAAHGFVRYAWTAIVGRLVFGALVFSIVVPMLVIAAYDLTRPTTTDIGVCVPLAPDASLQLQEACTRAADPWFGAG